MEDNIIKGEVISPGVAKGILCYVDFSSGPIPPRDNLPEGQIAREISRFEKESKEVIKELEETIAILKKDLFLEAAEIVQTHILMLEDAEFRRRVHEKVKKNRLVAEMAIEHVFQEMVAVLEKSESMLFTQRIADLRDLGMCLRNKLNKEDSVIFHELLKNVERPIIAVKELLPSFVLEAKERGVKGFIVEQGTPFAHAAILAKSFGLSVLRVVNFHNLASSNNKQVLIDSIHGRAIIEPSEDDINNIAMLTQETNLAEDYAQLPVKLWINVADPLQIKQEYLKGIEGIGLYRTEFVFMKNRKDFPTEDEQFVVYASFFKRCKDYPVTIRTLDIGGDKTLPYFSFGPQENPYLGFRAHRIYRFHPEIFITQIRAILRAGLVAKQLQILYPMIETVDDLWFVQGLLEKAIRSLKEEGAKYNEDFQQGVLVEVPSAAWNLRELLKYVDFASIGTNDLFQYFFAVDRNNANVYSSHQLENPVALQILKNIIDCAKELNKPLNICGEIASNINFLPILIGLGFEHLSIDIHSVPTVRKHLSSLDVYQCRKLAEECLKAKGTDELRDTLIKFNLFNQKKKPIPLVDSSEFIDPICKMVVYTDGNELVVTQGKKKFYFCCRQCRDKFLNGGT